MLKSLFYILMICIVILNPLREVEIKGLGGMAKRATIINEIRSKEKNVLLFDAETFFKELHILTILVEK